MLNVFPDLLFLQLLAPFLLSVALGIMLFWIGYSYLFKDRTATIAQLSTKFPKIAVFAVVFSGIFEITTGIFLIAGFLTQIMSIAGVLIAIDALSVKILCKNLDKVIKCGKMFYILVFIISLSLLFSGAGAFAVDLPL